MTADAGRSERTADRRPRLWHLPEILSLEIQLAEYDRPRISYRGTERVESRSAVELLVSTSDAIVPRAVTPALLIGDVPVSEYETVGHNQYLFVATEPEVLEEGAPISLGWPQYPERIRRTRFTYNPPARPVRTG